MSRDSQISHHKRWQAQHILQNDSDACQFYNKLLNSQNLVELHKRTYGQPSNSFSSSMMRQFKLSSSDPSRQSFFPLQTLVESMHAPYEHRKLYFGHLTFSHISSTSSVRLKQSALPSQTSSSEMQLLSPQLYSNGPQIDKTFAEIQ